MPETQQNVDYPQLVQMLKADLKHELTVDMEALLRKLVQFQIIKTLHLVPVAISNAIFSNLEGDYLEFGTNQGYSFRLAWQAYKENHEDLLKNTGMGDSEKAKLPAPMRFFAFDAFEQGLPQPKGIDDDGLKPLHWTEGSMAYPMENFLQDCLDLGIPSRQLIAVKGYYENTLTEELKVRHSLKKAAVIHIDCDLYESTVSALDFCTSLMQLGTYIVFDDWFRYRGSEDHGAFLAFKQWLDRNPQLNFQELGKFRGCHRAFICSRVIGSR